MSTLTHASSIHSSDETYSRQKAWCVYQVEQMWCLTAGRTNVLFEPAGRCMPHVCPLHLAFILAFLSDWCVSALGDVPACCVVGVLHRAGTMRIVACADVSSWCQPHMAQVSGRYGKVDLTADAVRCW